ncbi:MULTISPECIES: sporulation protein YpjB [Brevibacillus]|uniref:Sporulation protein n=1 Tax=Brevibacillus laterosporus TaxID=1465 RepID=A0AAP8U6C0_BRELA|nr:MULTISPECIES: sporulation protein YpjB [Brevibacillus]ATO51225.1 sporulation protein [Brevibacillus laterosporus DSM 25]AYB38633.1 sporulation protein [Brevibacillus laterosporus]MBG9771995.1 sporulation protein [Brevibacillus laterosporus]MBG9790828.1 sporulation protein [Brevibacillus laterosporus]MBG9797391.1 sporulation protein [Brevibacillus laterosporus]
MPKNIRMLLLLLVMGFLLAMPISYFVTKMNQPPEEKHLAELDKVAGEMLRATEKGDYDTAKLKIERLASQFPNETLPISLRIESLNAVTQSILSAKKAYASPKTTENRLLWHATQVRVAVDALSHQRSPMWRTYYNSYSKQMQNLLQAAVERDTETLRAQYEENYQLYLALRPAMTIQLKEQAMDKVTRKYEEIAKHLLNQKLDWQMMRSSIRELSSTMQEAFVGEDQTAVGSFMDNPESTYRLMVWISTLVTVSLAYVAWIKYSAMKQRRI